MQIGSNYTIRSRLQNSRFFSQNRFSVIERLSTVSLSVFSLAPDLLFDCSSVVEYAKIRTVLIIIIIASSNHRLMSAFEFSKLQISFCVVKHYFKIMEEHELKSKLSFRKKTRIQNISLINSLLLTCLTLPQAWSIKM